MCLREMILGRCETIRKWTQFVGENYTIASRLYNWIGKPKYSISQQQPSGTSCRTMSMLNRYYSLLNQDMPQISP